MNKKEKLISYFNSKDYIPLKIRELKVVLDVPDEDSDEFTKLISVLESEGKIMVSKRGNIVPVNVSGNCYAGVLQCNANGRFGFVVCDEVGDLYVSESNMGTAIHGDRVLVKKTGEYKHKPEGSVVKVIERNKSSIIGVVITKRKNSLRIRPDNSRYFKDIDVLTVHSQNANVGERVAVNDIYVKPDGKLSGKITAILGSSDRLSGLIEGIIIENKIKTEFNFDTLEQCKGFDENITLPPDREDFRNITVFTIDGETARDFDDAVSIEKLSDNSYRLGVHIADVSEYVRENTPLDNEAFERGTSVYLPDRVIPMLPEKLSNGICSLMPGVDRLTLSVVMDIDNKGTVFEHRIVKSIIKSHERLTYNDVNSLIEGNNSQLLKRYASIYDDIINMTDLAEILRKRRFERGAIDFDFPEVEIIADSEGYPVDIKPVERGVSNRMIEEFMLIANETVAEFAYWAELPFVYRSHEPPSVEKLNSFTEFLKPFGLYLKGTFGENNPVNPKQFEQILKKVKDTSIERIVAETMLRSLMKADYKDVNTGHFGLAAKYYCHFTSPIRRYPDLMIHRILKDFIDGKDVMSYHTAKAAKKSSECEINSELCERDCDDLMKVAYMYSYIGQTFEGTVSSVKNFGMFVELNNGIEGLVRAENMYDDYYAYDEASQTLTGERTHISYTVGDVVSVVVANCDVILRKIDFVLSDDAGEYFSKQKNKRRKK